MTATWEEVFGTFDEKQGAASVPDAASGDGIVRTFEQCQEWAEKLNCTLRIAADEELFVDIDTEPQFELFLKMADWYNNQHIIYNNWIVTPSKQDLPHRHVVVKLRKPTSLVDRIAIQATLGSDPMREAISLKRAWNQEENVVVFFEPKAESEGKDIVSSMMLTDDDVPF